ncbi:MAG: LysM peptidoglycan-binding domain-containing protein [Pseudomonadota bacterium]
MPLGNGVNLQPSYYNSGDVHFGWDLMRANNNIKTVRIEIEPNRVDKATGWIQQACGQGLDVIATYHKFAVLGTNRAAELAAAANWWQRNYQALLTQAASYTVRSGDTLSALAQTYYGDASLYPLIADANASITDPNVIRVGQTLSIPARNRSITINLMNEWGNHNLTAVDYANAYNGALGMVRGVYSGQIIIDVPGWGQETAIAASAVKGYRTGGISITDANICLSVHIYRQAYIQNKRGSSRRRHGAMVRRDLDDLASTDRPCIVGEFGPGGPGQSDWSALVDHAKSLNWPVLGWAWNGDGGQMNMVTPAWSGNPRATSFSTSTYFNQIYAKLQGVLVRRWLDRMDVLGLADPANAQQEAQEGEIGRATVLRVSRRSD